MVDLEKILALQRLLEVEVEKKGVLEKTVIGKRLQTKEDQREHRTHMIKVREPALTIHTGSRLRRCVVACLFGRRGNQPID